MGYTNGHGDCWFGLTEAALYAWAEYIPYDFGGDCSADGPFSNCRQRFDDLVARNVRHLVLLLEADGRQLAAQEIRRVFDRVAAQATAMDDWCAANPVPSGSDIFWPPEDVAEAIGDPDFRIIRECYTALHDAKAAADGTGETDKKTDKQKKVLPPSEVNDCARYIRKQRELIAQGKRPKATKNALIAEHLGHDDTDAMDRQLRPSRFGWLLEIGQKTDK